MTAMRNVLATEYSSRLFEPDAVLAAQFYANFKVSPYTQPELRLMAAVLEDAISCLSIDFRSATVRQRKQHEEARQWFAADDESEWIFSFKNICEALGINPHYLRRGLIQSSSAEKKPAGQRAAKQVGPKLGFEPAHDQPPPQPTIPA
jgi:hypothetical protein